MFLTFAAVKPENSFQHFIPTEGITCSSQTGLVRVPEDHKSLNEAVMWIEQYNTFLTKINSKKTRMTTIVLGKGEHVVEVSKNKWGTDMNSLEIASALHIVGDPGVAKEEIVVLGGILFNAGIPGKCHLQHLTLRQAKGSGVVGESSFTMDDVLVEQCGHHGVLAWGTGGVGRCTNVEVRQCEWSGVGADDGASIILIGAKTTVHHNCTKGESDDYGLKVFRSSSSTIQLVPPLKKEQVATDNGGGGNWGGGADINQIVDHRLLTPISGYQEECVTQ